MSLSSTYVRRIEPLAGSWRSQTWDQGVFDTASRQSTPEVEGVIRTPQHVVMVTLTGGARRLNVHSDCGHRFSGPDQAGAVSFVPAGCERRLAMRDVASSWGSIALDPAMFTHDCAGLLPLDIGAFSNRRDPFIQALVGEFAAVTGDDSRLEPVWCEVMGLALAHHLSRRHAGAPPVSSGNSTLPPWQVRRVEDYVEARLSATIRISDLAGLTNLSTGHFHRAFRSTTGLTPLDYINGRRIAHARALLQSPHVSITEVAMAAGYASPSYFTRIFRRHAGCGPAEYRRAIEIEAGVSFALSGRRP